jgi:hypothetical protein
VGTTTEEGRRDLLAQLADAADELGLALACLSEAYELLDDATADRLEKEMFRPVQVAYGRAKRTHTEFATRSGLARRAFEQQSGGAPSQGAKALIENGVEASEHADAMLASLQDSLLPTEFGDPELRAALANVRELIGPVPLNARRLLNTLGR